MAILKIIEYLAWRAMKAVSDVFKEIFKNSNLEVGLFLENIDNGGRDAAVKAYVKAVVNFFKENGVAVSAEDELMFLDPAGKAVDAGTDTFTKIMSNKESNGLDHAVAAMITDGVRASELQLCVSSRSLISLPQNVMGEASQPITDVNSTIPADMQNWLEELASEAAAEGVKAAAEVVKETWTDSNSKNIVDVLRTDGTKSATRALLRGVTETLKRNGVETEAFAEKLLKLSEHPVVREIKNFIQNMVNGKPCFTSAIDAMKSAMMSLLNNELDAFLKDQIKRGVITVLDFLAKRLGAKEDGQTQANKDEIANVQTQASQEEIDDSQTPVTKGVQDKERKGAKDKERKRGGDQTQPSRILKEALENAAETKLGDAKSKTSLVDASKFAMEEAIVKDERGDGIGIAVKASSRKGEYVAGAIATNGKTTVAVESAGGKAAAAFVKSPPGTEAIVNAVSHAGGAGAQSTAQAMVQNGGTAIAKTVLGTTAVAVAKSAAGSGAAAVAKSLSTEATYIAVAVAEKGGTAAVTTAGQGALAVAKDATGKGIVQSTIKSAAEKGLEATAKCGAETVAPSAANAVTKTGIMSTTKSVVSTTTKTVVSGSKVATVAVAKRGSESAVVSAAKDGTAGTLAMCGKSSSGAQDLFPTALNLAEEELGCKSSNLLTKSVKEATEGISSRVSPTSVGVGLVVGAGIEAVSGYFYLQKQWEKVKGGEVTEKEYQASRNKRVIEGALNIGLSTLGSIAGQILMPGLGGVVGSMAGSFLSKAISRWL